jgi:hypothetical protein
MSFELHLMCWGSLILLVGIVLNIWLVCSSNDHSSDDFD